MAKRLTYEEVKTYIEEQCQDWYDFTLLSNEYINSFIKLHIKDSYGYHYYVSLSNIKGGHKSKSKLVRFASSNKFYIKNIELWLQNNRDGYKLISTEIEKINNDYKLLFECNKGHRFYMRFTNMKYLNQRCPECMGNRKYTYEEVKRLFQEKDYMLTSKKYKNAKSELEYVCNKHSELGIQKTTLNSFNQSNYMCKECLNEYKRSLYAKTQDEFESEIYGLVGDEYTVLGEYVNTHTKILILHNECNATWEVEPNAFLSGVRCPSCSVSSGENRIKEFLNINNIKYNMQVKFDNCRNIKPLPFDFSIINRNNKILFLIEYDGEGHYKPYRYGNKDEMLKKLKRQQVHDKRKNQYCKDNNIPLIRIPYWQFDKIEEILDKWLSKYGLIHKENIKEVV